LNMFCNSPIRPPPAATAWLEATLYHAHLVADTNRARAKLVGMLDRDTLNLKQTPDKLTHWAFLPII
jgi:hypothetical protein